MAHEFLHNFICCGLLDRDALLVKCPQRRHKKPKYISRCVSTPWKESDSHTEMSL